MNNIIMITYMVSTKYYQSRCKLCFFKIFYEDKIYVGSSNMHVLLLCIIANTFMFIY